MLTSAGGTEHEKDSSEHDELQLKSELLSNAGRRLKAEINFLNWASNRNIRKSSAQCPFSEVVKPLPLKPHYNSVCSHLIILA